MPTEQEREEWISRRAYGLWEEAGRPEGHDYEHWSMANSEWERQAGEISSANRSWDDEAD